MSIGIAQFPDYGGDLIALPRRSDIAMYWAKTTGVGHCYYDDCPRDAAESRARLTARFTSRGDRRATALPPPRRRRVPASVAAAHGT